MTTTARNVAINCDIWTKCLFIYLFKCRIELVVKCNVWMKSCFFWWQILVSILKVKTTFLALTLNSVASVCIFFNYVNKYSQKKQATQYPRTQILTPSFLSYRKSTNTLLLNNKFDRLLANIFSWNTQLYTAHDTVWYLYTLWSVSNLTECIL